MRGRGADKTLFLSFATALSADQIQTSSSVLGFTRDALSKCPTDRYLIVSQPGLNTEDIRRSNGCALPHLCQAVDDKRIKGKAIVSEVVGDLADADLSDYIESVCAKENKAVSVDQVQLPPLSLEDRAGAWVSNGTSLRERLGLLDGS